VAFYLYERSGYRETFDIYGNFLGSGELPLETPLVDPIDAILIAEGVGSIVVKGVAAGVKSVVAKAPRIGASLARTSRAGIAAIGMGMEDAASVAMRRGASELITDVGSKGAIRETGEVVSKAGVKEAAGASKAASEAAAPAVAEATAPAVTQAAAPTAAKTITPKAPADVAQALRTRYGGRLTDSSNALEGLITRVRDPALRQHGRAASSELRDVIRILEKGEVDGKAVGRVELIPSSSAGRTPDIRIHFQDGTTTLWEVRSITSAPQNRVVAKADSGPAALARSLAEGTQQRPVSGSQIGQAILSKAKNTPARPSQIAGGGTISVHVSAANVTRTQVADSVQNIANQLGSHVERIEVTYLGERLGTSAPLRHETMTFLRQLDGSYLAVP
jgi:hypothetical protein